MPQIGMDNLTRDHLRQYWRLEAVAGFDDETQREIVWESARQPPLSKWEGAASEMKTLFIRVPAITKSILESLKRLIAELEAHPAGSRVS
jgi:hypothetical protein